MDQMSTITPFIFQSRVPILFRSELEYFLKFLHLLYTRSILCPLRVGCDRTVRGAEVPVVSGIVSVFLTGMSGRYLSRSSFFLKFRVPDWPFGSVFRTGAIRLFWRVRRRDAFCCRSRRENFQFFRTLCKCCTIPTCSRPVSAFDAHLSCSGTRTRSVTLGW